MQYQQHKKQQESYLPGLLLPIIPFEPDSPFGMRFCDPQTGRSSGASNPLIRSSNSSFDVPDGRLPWLSGGNGTLEGNKILRLMSE